MKNILITGSNSYIGNSLTEWLAKYPNEYNIESISVRDEQWKEKDFSGYDVVFHVAGIAHVSTDPNMEEKYYKVNRDLTINVAKKAKNDGVKQFIFMSSIIVYGDSTAEKRVIDRSTVPTPSNFYGRSKLQAEEGILPLGDDKFNVVVIRPPMIYGRDSKGNYPKLAKAAKLLPIFPNINNQRSMLHIDHLSEFIRLMVENEEKGIFFPQNKEYVNTSEMVKMISEMHGKNMLLTKAFNPIVNGMSSRISILNKMFGNLVYDKELSEYKQNYQVREARETIVSTELEKTKIQYHYYEKLEKNLVSIIMPAYNCEDLIADTLKSVQAQEYKNWEIVIVDDCSTDNTVEVIKQYQLNDARIRLHQFQKNAGAAMARNKAIELARGEYLAFLDSDDVWKPEKLSKQLNFMKQNNYHFTCTSYNKIDEEGNDLNRIIETKKKRDYDGVLKTCPGNSTVIYNADKLGKFKIPNIKKRNDYVMWLQVIKNEKYLNGLNEVLSSHRIRESGISNNKSSLVKYHWDVYRKIEQLSLIKSLYLLIYWVLVTGLKLR